MKAATVAELNAAQARWMAYDVTDKTNEQIDAFCREINRIIPRSFLNVTIDGAWACPMENSMPVWSARRAIVHALAWIRERPGFRSDVAWCGFAGRWVPVRVWDAAAIRATISRARDAVFRDVHTGPMTQAKFERCNLRTAAVTAMRNLCDVELTPPARTRSEVRP